MTGKDGYIIMAIYDFPDGIFPQANTGGFCEVISIVQLSAGSKTGAQQAIMRGAGELWRQELTIITTGNNEKNLTKILMQLRGPFNKLRCPDLYAYSRQVDSSGNAVFSGTEPIFSDGTRFADGAGFKAKSAPVVTLNGAAAKGDTQITITVNNNSSELFQGLDRIQIGDVLYAVLSYDSTTQVMDIHPPLRSAIADGTAVTSHKAQGLWRLADSQQIIPDHVQNTKDGPVRTRKITLIEAL